MSSFDCVRAELDEHKRQRQLADARTEVHERVMQRAFLFAPHPF